MLALPHPLSLQVLLAPSEKPEQRVQAKGKDHNRGCNCLNHGRSNKAYPVRPLVVHDQFPCSEGKASNHHKLNIVTIYQEKVKTETCGIQPTFTDYSMSAIFRLSIERL